MARASANWFTVFDVMPRRTHCIIYDMRARQGQIEMFHSLLHGENVFGWTKRIRAAIFTRSYYTLILVYIA